jgi:hypothetical protein
MFHVSIARKILWIHLALSNLTIVNFRDGLTCLKWRENSADFCRRRRQAVNQVCTRGRDLIGSKSCPFDLIGSKKLTFYLIGSKS